MSRSVRRTPEVPRIKRVNVKQRPVDQSTLIDDDLSDVPDLFPEVS